MKEKNVLDRAVKKEHIRNIRDPKIEVVRIANMCPRCKGELTIRSGKKGTFKGCSNYPKCRYTESY